MIFRRSGKNSFAAAQSRNAQQQARHDTPPAMRRDPELSASSANASPSSPTAPVSPLAMAQARRNPNSPFNNRPEASRKMTVGRDISLNGEIGACDHLIVEGTVKATVKGGQMLEIHETGTFSGIVDIEQAEIAGRFDGTLTVHGRLILRPTANVTGSVRYGSLQVDTGAALNGEISVLQKAAAPTVEQPVQQAPKPQAPNDNSAASTAMRETGLTASQQVSSSASYNMSSVIEQSGYLKASA